MMMMVTERKLAVGLISRASLVSSSNLHRCHSSLATRPTSCYSADAIGCHLGCSAALLCCCCSAVLLCCAAVLCCSALLSSSQSDSFQPNCTAPSDERDIANVENTHRELAKNSHREFIPNPDQHRNKMFLCKTKNEQVSEEKYQ